jgi:hypothetical protein
MVCARPVAFAVSGLLEPVDALRQLGTVDAVPRPAADDLPETLAKGAALGQVLKRAAKATEVLPDLRTRAQGAAQASPCILGMERCGKR